MKQYATLTSTVFFWFASNNTSGSGDDGATPACDVRLAGAAADAAPVYSPTPVLLSAAGYPAGCYEVAIAATAGNGFAANNTYAVFCTLAADSQNPTGFVGSFDLKPVEANTKQVSGTAQTGNDNGADINTLITNQGDWATATGFAEAGDTMKISAGTAAGQLDFTSGVVKSNLAQILGTALTETAGLIAAGFKKVFNIADPIFTAASPNVPSAALADYKATGFATPTNITAAAGCAVSSMGANVLTAAAINADALTAAKIAADVHAECADAVWDEVLTGATHNTATTAGRRLRQLTDNAVRQETAQAGSVNTITLDENASATDRQYDPGIIMLYGGTGAGQSRRIIDYIGATKVATVNQDWRVNPSSDSEFVIFADSGLEYDNEGAAVGGGATTITLNGVAVATNDIYNGQIIATVSGIGKGQARIITDYVGATKVATVHRAWATNPAAGTGYFVMQHGQADLVTMINDTQSITDLKDFVDAGYDPSTNKVQGVVLTDTCMTNTDLVTAAAVKTAIEAAGSDLDYLMIALVNKMEVTEADGATNQYNDANELIGSIAAAFSSDGSTTTRKRMVQ